MAQKAKPAPAPEPAPIPRQIGGFAIFGGVDGLNDPDPMQAAMDAAVAEHNARQAAALAAVLERGRKPR